MAEISKMAVNNTTYDIKDTSARAALVPATINAPGLMSAADKSKLDNIANYATANVGTVTGIKVNGERIGTANGTVLDIGTVLSSHQDISGKADFDETVTNVSYNGTQKKIYKTIGDADPTEVVSVATLKTALSLAKSDIGLGNVDNKSAATIISEITAQDVINSLGYTPPQTNTTYTLAQDTNDAHKLIFTPSSGTAKTITMPDTNTWTELSTTAGGYVGTPLPGSDNVFLNGLGGWTAPPSAVTSVAGQTGTVTLNKGDVGLANVDNTSDANKPISTATQSALDLKLNTSLKGAANGLAELDSNGKVPSAQLPSYVDDILEYADTAHFPVQGESGKIYVAQDTNLTYRWGTNSYVEISPSIALGETASTAYAGDKGAAAYAHAVTNKGIEVYDTYQGAKVAKFVKVLTNAEGHIIASVDVAKADITALGIPGQDTTYTFDGTYNASTNKVATVSTVTTAIGNLGAAASKAVDTSISSSNSTSTSVPTTAAVYTFVTGQNYLTSHQDITGKADKLYTVSSVDYDGTNLKLTKTINGTTSDILTVATLKSDLNFTKSDLGLGNVENKSSATIRGELTSTNVTTALGFTPIANNSVASSSALGLVKIGYTTSDRNYAVQLNTSNQMYVNVPWTDHYAWSDITGKPLTLTKNTTGFSISGGTTSKTLTVGADYTLGAACTKGVTDNSSSTAVTSTDTNLITARTLYYAGYVKSSGVTSVATGAGLTGGTITSTGTISINGMDTSSGSTSKCLTQKGTWVDFNNYSHPTGAGNNHIPSGGSSGQFLKYSSSGVAAWSALPSASTSASGIVSLSSSLTSTSETVAATSKAVKTLNDNKIYKYSDAVTGDSRVNLISSLVTYCSEHLDGETRIVRYTAEFDDPLFVSSATYYGMFHNIYRSNNSYYFAINFISNAAAPIAITYSNGTYTFSSLGRSGSFGYNQITKNLNLFTDTGVYSIESATNGPFRDSNNLSYGTLLVVRYSSSTYITQLFINMINNQIAIRRNFNGTWSSWTPLMKAWWQASGSTTVTNHLAFIARPNSNCVAIAVQNGDAIARWPAGINWDGSQIIYCVPETGTLNHNILWTEY